MKNDPIIFELAVAHDKPSSFRKDKSHVCPFCDVDSLTDIYEKNDTMIWLHNRFPTLRDTLQTVLIESDNHDGDITNYSQEYNRELMHFALHCFDKMRSDSRFKSVLWYKNFGPLSAGSLSHPHMQLVGLEKEDGYKYIQANNFTGISVFQDNNIEVNFSTHPVQGYQEINVNLLDRAGINTWADWIQYSAQYVLKEMYNGRCTSYNLFFYPRYDSDGICCKLVPRFYASPYFVGYKLSQCNDEKTLRHEVENLREFVKTKNS